VTDFPQFRTPDTTPTRPAGAPTTSNLTTLIGDAGNYGDAYLIAHPGGSLDGRFQILEVKGGPGVSGMGVVYIVESGEERFAAKTFQHHFSQNLPLVERFLRESRTWLLTGFHTNIVHPYFIDIIDAAPYLFMEYIEPDDRGMISLADRLQSGALDMREALHLAIQCCDGMIHATSAVPGLVHRDLKPENLLITRDGTLKITDFGLVRCNISEDIPIAHLDDVAGREDLTQAGATFGTPAYMAPEQFVEAATVGQAADIYAFGCCFYEAIGGSRLFTIRADTAIEHLLAMRRFHQEEPPVPLQDRVADCPQDLDRVIMRCLEKSAKERWPSFRELRGELAFVLEHAFATTYSTPAYQHTSARQVAHQMRSLTLLDGYQRAVRLRNLREHQDASPYAFHLALASYFHTNAEAEEERRQLEKAMRVREPKQGYEAVRRLGELLIEAGELNEAAELLNAYLVEEPNGLDRCLEPLVYLHVARKEFDAAEELVSRFPQGLRTDALLAKIYRASERRQDLMALHVQQIAGLIQSIRSDIGAINPGDRVGWDSEDDVDVLRAIMAVLAPDCSLSPLDHVEHAIWPDLEAYPDFSAAMAWLSEAFGVLSEIGANDMPYAAGLCRQLADRLGYPHRLSRHLMRDEIWFWTNEAPDPYRTG